MVEHTLRADDAGDRLGLKGGNWVENRASTTWFPHVNTAELWNYRELVFFLALRDLKLRYRQTAFGVMWAVLQPLAGVAIFTVIFGRLVEVPSDGIPYLVFVYAGLVLWTYVSTGVSAAAEALVMNDSLVTKVYFPRLLAPLAAVLPGILDLAISLVIVVIFMAIYHVGPTSALVLLPLWLGAAAFLALGVGLWLSALNVLYRDVRYALGFVIQVWFFASPIIFPSSLFDGHWRFLYALNPMVGLLDGFRWSLVAGRAPGMTALVSLMAGLLVLGSGVIYFRRVERRFADVI